MSEQPLLDVAPGAPETGATAAAGPVAPILGRGRPLLEVVVAGTPAPQGSKRVVPSGKPGGRVHVIESSKKVLPWRNDVMLAARRAADEQLGDNFTIEGPLRVDMVFTLSKPQSAPKRRATYPDRTPDLSKLIRATEDALVACGAIRDDARIVEYGTTAKRYPNEGPDAMPWPGAVIRVYAIDGTD